LKCQERNLWYPVNIMDVRASLDVLERRNTTCHCQELKPIICNPLQTHPPLLLGVRLHDPPRKGKICK
jgi:hypothetical protein